LTFSFCETLRNGPSDWAGDSIWRPRSSDNPGVVAAVDRLHRQVHNAFQRLVHVTFGQQLACDIGVSDCSGASSAIAPPTWRLAPLVHVHYGAGPQAECPWRESRVPLRGQADSTDPRRLVPNVVNPADNKGTPWRRLLIGSTAKEDLPVEFENYAREHSHQLLRFAAVLTNDNGIAEDVVQNVLIKAHARWDRISMIDNRQAYLRRMVVNELTSWRRKWARYVPHPNTALDRPVGDGTGQVDDHVELVGELAKLPAKQRAAVTLRFLEDLSDAEIAEVLNCREVTVRGYIHRALNALRIEMTAPSALPVLHGKEA